VAGPVEQARRDPIVLGQRQEGENFVRRPSRSAFGDVLDKVVTAAALESPPQVLRVLGNRRPLASASTKNSQSCAISASI